MDWMTSQWRDSVPLAAALLLAGALALRRGSSDVHKRGARVLTGGQARRAIARRRRRKTAALTLAGVRPDACEETRHFKLIGTTGAGKSTAIAGLLTVAPSVELRPLVAGSPAQPFLDPENARMFGSIRSVAGSAAAAFQYLEGQRARSFSVRDWVRAGRGVLFIPYAAPQIAALRSVIAAWVRLAIFEAMASAEGDQRLWFVVDELDSLGAIDGLKDALARLRKFGGRCVLAFQSLAQVSHTYGSGEAQTLVENCGNTLILRCSGSEHGGTSQFASRLIVEREVIRRQASRGHDRSGFLSARGARRTSSISEQHVIETAVLPAELEQLPNLSGYLKTAASPVWLRVSFRGGA